MLLSRTAVYKTRNTKTGNGMRGTRGMSTRILVNLLEDSGECCYFIIAGKKKIPENVPDDSGEC